MKMEENKYNISGLICVSEKDIDFLFETVLSSCLRHVNFIKRINIVTPNKEKVLSVFSRIKLDKFDIKVFDDSYLLSDDEMKMPGWSKQQIIKLRSYKLDDSDYILSIGADTVIRKDLKLDIFINQDYKIINHRIHNDKDKHLIFEEQRVENIYKLLNLKSKQETRKDYIFDLFMFDKDILKEMEQYFISKFNGYSRIFPEKVNDYNDMNTIGEWSLYSIFIIEILKEPFKMIGREGFIDQIHSKREFLSYEGDSVAVHFVDASLIKDKILKII